MRKRFAALLAGGLVMASLSGCDILNKAITTAQNIQGATRAALASIQWPVVLAAMSQDMVGSVTFTCPTISPTTAGAAAYTFTFGTPGCSPSPEVIGGGTVSGSASVAVSGNSLTITLTSFSYAGTTLDGVATVTSSGSAGNRTFVVSGSMNATYQGTTYTATVSNLSVNVTGSGSSVALTANGTVTVAAGDISFSLQSTNLMMTQSTINGSAKLSASGGLSASVDLAFTTGASGVTVAGKLGAISFTFEYAL